MLQLVRAAARQSPPTAQVEWLTADTITNPTLKAGVEWWRAARGERPYPSRQDMHPRQMTSLLPYMSLLKVIDNGADFEHRIVGDLIVQSFRINIQNRRFSDIAREEPDFIEHCLRFFRMVLETGAPVAWHARTKLGNPNTITTFNEVILLPLGRNTVDHVLCFGGTTPRPASESAE